MSTHSSFQASLPGFDTSRNRAEGLFFAIFPDAVTAKRIEQLAHRLSVAHGLGGKPFPRGRFHITLRHLGIFSEELPEGAIEWANQVAANTAMRPFRVEFNHAGHFGGKSGHRPFVLRGDEGLPGLFMLRDALERALEQKGVPRGGKFEFTPHVTLLYDHHDDKDNPGVSEYLEPISWIVHELVLVRSLLGRSQYEVLARWPLSQ
jgi:2'-5' RNA ligase